MKPDERIDRGRLFGQVPQEVQMRLRGTLSQIREEESPVKKMRYQPILIALMILLLCGVAVAAVTGWSVRESLTYTDQDGNARVNEALVEMVQPVGRVAEGKALRVEVVDAVFDGKSLVAAWTMTNMTKDRVLYVILEPTEAGIPWNNMGGAGGTEIFIEPGETLTGSVDMLVGEGEYTGTVQVGMRYDVLAPIDEILRIPFDTEWDEIEKLRGGGQILVHSSLEDEEPYNILVPLPEYGYGHEIPADDPTTGGLLTASGRFERIEKVDFSFDVAVQQTGQSLLPKGHAAERTYDDFTMRVTKAELTPNTLEVLVEAVFEDQATAEQYRMRREKETNMLFLAVDETNSNSAWNANANYGPLAEAPEEREDGTWVIPYFITYVQMRDMPERVTIAPVLMTWPEGSRPMEMDVWDGVVLDGRAP